MTPLLLCNCGNAVNHVKGSLPSKEQLDNVSELFKLFGDSTRSGILSALSCHELCVSEICEILDMNISAVSHQLRLLKNCGIIDSRRDGKLIYYRIADRQIEKIFESALLYSEGR